MGRPDSRWDLVRAPFPKVPIAAIDPHDIAAVAAVALTAPGQEGQAYVLSGSNVITLSEQVEILAKVLGRDLRFVGLTLEETEAELRRENPEEFAQAFLRFFARGEFDDSETLPTVREMDW
jgi:uncharacterized protein YbjT (DUF2867 family)